MKEIKCINCNGYGQIQTMRMDWNGPDIDVDYCPDCEGRGFTPCPDPNILLKEICKDEQFNF